jgi:hypothetical protein
MRRWIAPGLIAAALALAGCSALCPTRPAAWGKPDTVVAPSAIADVLRLTLDTQGRLPAGSVVGNSSSRISAIATGRGLKLARSSSPALRRAAAICWLAEEPAGAESAALPAPQWHCRPPRPRSTTASRATPDGSFLIRTAGCALLCPLRCPAAA